MESCWTLNWPKETLSRRRNWILKPGTTVERSNFRCRSFWDEKAKGSCTGRVGKASAGVTEMVLRVVQLSSSSTLYWTVRETEVGAAWRARSSQPQRLRYLRPEPGSPSMLKQKALVWLSKSMGEAPGSAVPVSVW